MEIAFKIKLGLYELLVIPFGLTNAPSTFMRLMNQVLRSLIGKCMVVYFDNILFYSSCIDDHILYVQSVLLLLRQECLYVSLEKCTFCTSKVDILSYVVGFEEAKVDAEKVKVIQSWPIPKIVGDIGSFHRLASFYRLFVEYFNTLASPLNEIVKKDTGKLRESHSSSLQNFSKTFQLKCDASNVGVGALEPFRCDNTIYYLKSFWSIVIIKPLNILGVKISLVRDMPNGLNFLNNSHIS
ncbi:Retrovirus-related Pol polyprotein from transposon gypsy, partial [Mucuna pruriens]